MKYLFLIVFLLVGCIQKPTKKQVIQSAYMPAGYELLSLQDSTVYIKIKYPTIAAKFRRIVEKYDTQQLTEKEKSLMIRSNEFYNLSAGQIYRKANFLTGAEHVGNHEIAIYINNVAYFLPANSWYFSQFNLSTYKDRNLQKEILVIKRHSYTTKNIILLDAIKELQKLIADNKYYVDLQQFYIDELQELCKSGLIKQVIKRQKFILSWISADRQKGAYIDDTGTNFLNISDSYILDNY